MRHSARTLRFACIASMLLLLAIPATAQDVLTVGSATPASNIVELPVYVRDVSGTSLGVDQAAGNKLQGLAFRLDLVPASAVKTVSFARAGVTTTLTPTYEISLKPSGAVTYLGSFHETTAAVPFTSDATAPGDQVGKLLLTLNGPAADTVITVSFDSATATLSNQAGTSSETVSNGKLTLVNGTITIPSFTAQSITPDNGAAAGNAVAIAGAGFDNAATVSVGGSALSGSTVSATSITGTTPSLAAGALYDVVVTNPGNVTRTLVKGWFADFTDVPASHNLHNFVESIVRWGVTSGCGGGKYCPTSNVTRAQMAVFLLRSKEGDTYFPPPATGTLFSDVPASYGFAPWIEELARRGITAGCGGGKYCPTSSVTRAQMAVFLLTTLEGTSYVPPPATGMFSDVPTTSGFAKWIEELARRGITAGCGGGKYCPSNPNTRGQMAVFLKTTFALP